MSWATPYIAQLLEGKTVSFRPRGNSMTGKISSGQLCTVEPIKDIKTVRKGDIVLCKVGGAQYLHLVSSVSGERFQISNNHNHVNGWTTAKNIFGRLINVC